MISLQDLKSKLIRLLTFDDEIKLYIIKIVREEIRKAKSETMR
jgi:hypothetical protein